MMNEIHEPYRAPFDFDGVLAWLGARAIPGVERVDSGVYSRGSTRVWHEEGVVRATDRSAVGRSAVGGSDPPPSADRRPPTPSSMRVRRLFDLDAEPSAIARTLSRDRMLAPLLRKRPGIRVPGTWNPFELAVRAIVGQQVSVAGARTVLGRMAAEHGLAPERLADANITGMPHRRAETIRILARAVASGEIDLDTASTDELIALPGIGPWTASYIAMRLGNADAFPAGDLILRRNAGNLTEKELLHRADAWRPFRAYAAMLLWTR